MLIRHKVYTLILWIALAIPVLHLYLWVSAYNINIPAWDDYDTSLSFMRIWEESSTAWEKIKLLIKQHNEHRIMLVRIGTVVTYEIWGTIRFDILVWIANLFLVGVAIFLIRSLDRENFLSYSLSAISIMLIALQPQYADGMLWATTALSSFPITLCALATAMLLERGSWSGFIVGSLVMVVGVFSQGNGILIPPLMLLVLLIQKNFLRAAIWCVIGVMAIALFFVGYEQKSHPSFFEEVIHQWRLIIEYFFVFIGSSFGFSDPDRSFWSGIATLISFGALCIAGLPWKKPSLFVFGLFILASAALAAITRGLSGISYALSPGRYTLACTILGCTIVAGLQVICSQKRAIRFILTGFSALALWFNIASYKHYGDKLREYHAVLVDDLVRWYTTGKGLTYPWFDQSGPNFEAALAAGHYSPPFAELGSIVGHSVQSDVASVSGRLLRGGIQGIRIGRGYLFADGFVFLKGHATADFKVVLQSLKDVVVIKPKIMHRPDLAFKYRRNDREQTGFLFLLPTSDLNSGLYRVGFIFHLKEGNVFVASKATITIDPSVIPNSKHS